MSLGLIGLGKDLTKQPEYGIITSIPVFNSISVGGLVTTEKTVGITVTLEF